MDNLAIVVIVILAIAIIICLCRSCSDDSPQQQPEIKLVSVPGTNHMPIVAQPPPMGYQVQPSAPMAPLPSTSITLQIAPPVDLLANQDTSNAFHQPLPPPQYPTDTVVAIPSSCDFTEQLQLTRHPRPNVATVVNDDDESSK
ncbi:MAG: hypothetical protein J3Q66DRAFT_343526 [Benniella sp.]|nr:MAG: hypothetical protein J3Q66DRAFT_343526 [Benniella sp.]